MDESLVMAALERIERALKVQGATIGLLLEAVLAEDESAATPATDLDGNAAGGERTTGDPL